MNSSSQKSKGGLYLAGTGSFAVEVAGWARDAGLEIAGLVELLDARRIATTVHGYTVLAAEHAPPGATVAIAAGGDRTSHWAVLAEHGWHPAAIVHPAATVARSAAIGGGTIVGPGAIVGAETEVAEHVLLSRGVLVGHHTQIGPFASLLPGANVASHVQIGAGTTVGMGGIVVDHTSIGTGATVAAGAVVLRPVESGVRVQGVPARVYEP